MSIVESSVNRRAGSGRNETIIRIGIQDSIEKSCKEIEGDIKIEGGVKMTTVVTLTIFTVKMMTDRIFLLKTTMTRNPMIKVIMMILNAQTQEASHRKTTMAEGADGVTAVIAM